jgi:hypothetical protein
MNEVMKDKIRTKIPKRKSRNAFASLTGLSRCKALLDRLSMPIRSALRLHKGGDEADSAVMSEPEELELELELERERMRGGGTSLSIGVIIAARPEGEEGGGTQSNLRRVDDGR